MHKETICNIWNGTMFVDLDWPLNASSLLSASAELLVIIPSQHVSILYIVHSAKLELIDGWQIRNKARESFLMWQMPIKYNLWPAVGPPHYARPWPHLDLWPFDQWWIEGWATGVAFRNFGTPLITFERIELSASNLAQTFVWLGHQGRGHQRGESKNNANLHDEKRDWFYHFK